MSDIFHEIRLKRIDGINKRYFIELDELKDRRQAEFTLLYQEIEIKQAGWEAFERGETLHKNPYRFSKEPDESNYWKVGWEMSYADNETSD